MTPLPDAELDRIEQRALACDPDEPDAEIRAENSAKKKYCNAAFMITARTHVLALVAEIRRLKREKTS